jgi:formate hydrogenlyase subunit 6/NADH:ubiquinone oxidoreductase subunit I
MSKGRNAIRESVASRSAVQPIASAEPRLLGLTGITEEQKIIIQSKPTKIPEQVTCPVSPPGSGSIAHFTATCTACHLCVSACPSRVLVPSFLEFGLAGVMQPRMNFHTGHCNYDCTICLDVCPTGAILPLKVEEKKLKQLGVAKFIKENCVVFTDNTACGACSEHCLTKAVDMWSIRTRQRKLKIPE